MIKYNESEMRIKEIQRLIDNQKIVLDDAAQKLSDAQFAYQAAFSTMVGLEVMLDEEKDKQK